MQNTRKAQQGFTLIEMMVTVAIVAILSAIAYPTYTNYIQHSRRAEALSALSDAAARLERYYAQNGSYTNNLTLLGLGSGATYNTPNSYYNMFISATTTTYTVTATAQGLQSSDSSCPKITITDAGIPNDSSAACWK